MSITKAIDEIYAAGKKQGGLTPSPAYNTITNSCPHGSLWSSSLSYILERSCNAIRSTSSAFFLRLNSSLSMAFCVGRPNGRLNTSYALGACISGLLARRGIATISSSMKAILLIIQENRAVNNKLFQLRKDVTTAQLHAFLACNNGQALAQANIIEEFALERDLSSPDNKDTLQGLLGSLIELLDQQGTVCEKLVVKS